MLGLWCMQAAACLMLLVQCPHLLTRKKENARQAGGNTPSPPCSSAGPRSALPPLPRRRQPCTARCTAILCCRTLQSRGRLAKVGQNQQKRQQQARVDFKAPRHFCSHPPRPAAGRQHLPEWVRQGDLTREDAGRQRADAHKIDDVGMTHFGQDTRLLHRQPAGCKGSRGT